jgi:hypothetical protein
VRAGSDGWQDPEQETATTQLGIPQRRLYPEHPIDTFADGHLDAVCLSISFPNYKMLTR